MMTPRNILWVCSIILLSVARADGASIEEYGINSTDKVTMSFRSEAAFNNFVFVEAMVEGNGNARVSFKMHGQEPQRLQVKLSKEDIRNVIQLYAGIDFLHFKKTKDRRHYVKDVGKTTFYYRVLNQENTVIDDGEMIAELSELAGWFWKLVNEEIALDLLEKEIAKKEVNEQFGTENSTYLNGMYLHPEKVNHLYGEYLLKLDLPLLEAFPKGDLSKFDIAMVLDDLKLGWMDGMKLVPGLLVAGKALLASEERDKSQGIMIQAAIEGNLSDVIECLKLISSQDFGTDFGAWERWYRANTGTKN